MNNAKLYILSGLPGTGKTTLAKMLAARIQAVHLRIDTIEQAIRDLFGFEVQGEGYRLAYRIAADNLKLGLDVIADSVNPWQLTRQEWQAVADGAGASYCNIEITCRNAKEHRERVEGRDADIDRFELPTWEDVINRDYHEWQSERIRLDTSGKTVAESYEELLSLIQGECA